MQLGLEDALEMFSRYQRSLYSYILSMVHNPTDAEDVLQNTNIVVWQKFRQFQPETDFRAWVFKICYYEILKLLGRKRPSGVSFRPELLDELSVEYRRREDLLEMREQALPGCVEELPPPDRDLLNAVYGRGIDVSLLSKQLGRKPTSVYRSLRRIREWLHDCIERRLRETGP